LVRGVITQQVKEVLAKAAELQLQALEKLQAGDPPALRVPHRPP
jgi:hypothetical protein